MARLVVLAWGNAARGDDGIGPALAAEIAARDLPEVTVIEDYQLQIEHALDLAAADLALFVDAARSGQAPYAFRAATAGGVITPFSHALAPEAVLAVFEQVIRRPAPPAFVLAVRGAAFALGTPIGATALAHMAAARPLIERLLARREPADWRGLVAPQPSPAAGRPAHFGTTSTAPSSGASGGSG